MAIVVEKEVYEGIHFIKSSGKVDMFDRQKVAYLCRETGFSEAALWITENRCDYARGVLGGFKSSK